MMLYKLSKMNFAIKKPFSVESGRKAENRIRDLNGKNEIHITIY